MHMRKMRFVVYHIKSTMEKTSYHHEHHARKLVNKLNAEYPRTITQRESGEPIFAYATVEHYNTSVVKMVERVNLMSGKKYLEPSNTPNYLSPASEAYWSM